MLGPSHGMGGGSPPGRIGCSGKRGGSRSCDPFWDKLGFGAMAVTKPYEFMRFGDIHSPKSYKIIRFGNIHGPRPCECIGFGDRHDPKSD